MLPFTSTPTHDCYSVFCEKFCMHQRYVYQNSALPLRYHQLTVFPSLPHPYVMTIYITRPQVIATHIADRCAAALLPPHAHPPLPPVPPVVVVWDLFCGCGGNALPLARHFPVVVAVDINPDKLPLVRHNAAVYGVWHRVEAVCGDAYDVLATLTSRRNQPQTRSGSGSTSLVDGSDGGGDNEGDLAILAPPWGGPGYSASGAAFDLRTGFPSGDGFDLVAKVNNDADANAPLVVCSAGASFLFPSPFPSSNNRHLTPPLFVVSTTHRHPTRRPRRPSPTSSACFPRT